MNILSSDKQYQNSLAFIKKTKKQAKRLLSMSLDNPDGISVKNLAQAQELLAKLYGYESWHAMETSLRKPVEQKMYNNAYADIYKNILIPTIPTIELTQDSTTSTYNEKKKAPYLKVNQSIYSFIDISYNYCETKNDIIDLDNYAQFISSLYHIIHLFKNKNFPEVSLLIINQPLQSDAYAWKGQIELAKDCNISEETAKSLFATAYPTKMPHALHFTIVIKSEEDTISLHQESITEILYSIFPHIGFSSSFKKSITEHELSLILPTKTDTFFEDKLKFSSSSSWFDSFINKKTLEEQYILEVLTRLSMEQQNFYAKLDMQTEHFTLFVNKFLKEKTELIFHITQKDPTYIPNALINNTIPPNYGIPFIHTKTNQIQFYDCFSDKSHNNNLFIGHSGSGKTTLANYIEYHKILHNLDNSSLISTSLYISKGSQKPLYNLLVSTLDTLTQSKIHYLTFNQNNHFINYFDLPFGLRRPSYHSNILIQNLIKLYSPMHGSNKDYIKYKALYNTLDTLINTLYTHNENNPKMYQKGIIEEIDCILPEEKTNNSWFDITDFLFSKGLTSLAKQSHAQAMPILEDFICFLQESSYVLQNEYSFGLEESHNFILKIKSLIDKAPYLNKPSNFFIQEDHIYFIDLSEVNEQNYLSVLLNCTSLEWMSNYDMLIHPSSIYNDYYKDTFHNSNKLSIFFDDYKKTDLINYESILTIARESRKFNIHFTLIMDEADSNILDFSTNTFLTSNVKLGNEWLVNYDIVRNSFSLMKNYRSFFSHNHTQYKLKMTQSMLIALCKN